MISMPKNFFKQSINLNLILILLLIITVSYNLVTVTANPDAKRLYDDLLSSYNRLIRPVSNYSDSVLIKLGLRLSQLIELNLKDQILTTNVWLEHEWIDGKFRWEPVEYGGITELYVPSEHIWVPDIVLYNNADGEYVITTMTKAVLHHTGKVFWNPPAIFKSSCQIDVKYFPYDEQTCFMKFGSWSYGGFQIDLQHINQQAGNPTVISGIDLQEYYPSVEWDILAVPAEAHRKYYSCCPEPFPDIFFNITLRRRTLFYTVNLIVPTVGISFLSVLVFYLPADSNEKIALCITILLSQTMFFLLISEIMPSTSLALPLLGKYLLFTMFLVGLCVIITIVILNIHYRRPSTHKMSPWIRAIFIRRLPRLLMMRVPQQLLADSKFKQRLKAIRRPNKKKTPLPIRTASLPASPVSLSGGFQGGGAPGSSGDFCNGHGSTMNSRLTTYLGMLGGGNGLNGGNTFNGLPSMIAMDELNELSVKKKYPFELEKAIHNVKFIQHHLQKQDEFNAEDLDWAFVAMVLDRLFLWVFTLATVMGTFYILCEAPSFCGDVMPAMDLKSTYTAPRANLTQFGPTGKIVT